LGAKVQPKPADNAAAAAAAPTSNSDLMPKVGFVAAHAGVQAISAIASKVNPIAATDYIPYIAYVMSKAIGEAADKTKTARDAAETFQTFSAGTLAAIPTNLADVVTNGKIFESRDSLSWAVPYLVASQLTHAGWVGQKGSQGLQKVMEGAQSGTGWVKQKYSEEGFTGIAKSAASGIGQGLQSLASGIGKFMPTRGGTAPENEAMGAPGVPGGFQGAEALQGNNFEMRPTTEFTQHPDSSQSAGLPLSPQNIEAEDDNLHLPGALDAGPDLGRAVSNLAGGRNSAEIANRFADLPGDLSVASSRSITPEPRQDEPALTS
jgi:hypothetical protein